MMSAASLHARRRDSLLGLIPIVFTPLPLSQIEVADAEIGAGRQLYRLAKRGEELLIDIVEDSRQGSEHLLANLIAANLRDMAAI